MRSNKTFFSLTRLSDAEIGRQIGRSKSATFKTSYNKIECTVWAFVLRLKSFLILLPISCFLETRAHMLLY